MSGSAPGRHASAAAAGCSAHPARSAIAGRGWAGHRPGASLTGRGRAGVRVPVYRLPAATPARSTAATDRRGARWPPGRVSPASPAGRRSERWSGPPTAERRPQLAACLRPGREASPRGNRRGEPLEQLLQRVDCLVRCAVDVQPIDAAGDGLPRTVLELRSPADLERPDELDGVLRVIGIEPLDPRATAAGALEDHDWAGSRTRNRATRIADVEVDLQLQLTVRLAPRAHVGELGKEARRIGHEPVDPRQAPEFDTRRSKPDEDSVLGEDVHSASGAGNRERRLAGAGRAVEDDAGAAPGDACS